MLAATDADAEVDRIVSALCAADCDPVLREQALIIADAQRVIRRIRMARSHGGDDFAGGAGRIAEIARLDRYERDALVRRRRAIARFDAIVECAQGREQK